jgi:hypothetical protein
MKRWWRSVATPVEPRQPFVQRVAETLDGFGGDRCATDQDRDRGLLMDDSGLKAKHRRPDVFDAVDAVELLNAALDRRPGSVEVTLYRDSVTVSVDLHPSSVDGTSR